MHNVNNAPQAAPSIENNPAMASARITAIRDDIRVVANVANDLIGKNLSSSAYADTLDAVLRFKKDSVRALTTIINGMGYLNQNQPSDGAFKASSDARFQIDQLKRYVNSAIGLLEAAMETAQDAEAAAAEEEADASHNNESEAEMASEKEEVSQEATGTEMVVAGETPEAEMQIVLADEEKTAEEAGSDNESAASAGSASSADSSEDGSSSVDAKAEEARAHEEAAAKARHKAKAKAHKKAEAKAAAKMRAAEQAFLANKLYFRMGEGLTLSDEQAAKLKGFIGMYQRGLKAGRSAKYNMPLLKEKAQRAEQMLAFANKA